MYVNDENKKATTSTPLEEPLIFEYWLLILSNVNNFGAESDQMGSATF